MKTLPLLAIIVLLAGCSAAPVRDEAAYLDALRTTQARVGADDARMLTAGDTICGVAKESTSQGEYILKLDYLMRTVKVAGSAGSIELVLVSGNALRYLCPAEGARLSSKS